MGAGVTTRDRGSSMSEESRFSISPRPRHLSLGGLSNFREHPRNTLPDGTSFAGMVPVFHDELPSLTSARTQSTRFSPFGDNELESPGFDAGAGGGSVLVLRAVHCGHR